MENNESIKEKINILYIRFKVRFNDLLHFTENDNQENDKIRILIIDFNFIFNNIYGFSHNISKNHIELFDEKYTDIHVIHLLSVLAHFRRFFYSRSKAKRNYLFLYRTDKNQKRPWLIFDKIIDKLKSYTDFIPFLYVNDNIKKPRLFFKEIIEQEFVNKINKKSNINYYLFSNDNLLKSYIFSISNKYFNDSELFYYTYNYMKFTMKDYKELYSKYKELLENEDRIIRKNFKENLYKLILINNLDISFQKQRTKKKITLMNDCFVNKTNSIDNLISKQIEPVYKEVIEDLLTNNMYKDIVYEELINKKIKLYDKTLLTMNMNIEDDNLQNIADWLFESENIK